ncbi:MAG: hypothetical protein K2W85_08005 [Phycisphaerales bacterium]|nr:hypothetical protein [Phycisphaerales bacterium]
MKRLCAIMVGLAILAAWLGGPPRAYAQPVIELNKPEDVTAPAAPTRATAPGRGTGEVQLKVLSFGLGNRPRAGEWTGVPIEVTDSSTKVRNVMVRLACADLDGDLALMQRVIVTNPGTPQRVWIYLRLPFSRLDDSTFEITAHEAEEVGGAGDTVRYQPGRLLGTTRYRVPTGVPVDTAIGLIGVVGNRAAGLEQYANLRDSGTGNYAITGHELTELVGGLSPAALPDRWFAYSSLQALVWASDRAEDQPTQLRDAWAEALREYVQRGGHLIVILPQVGQVWLNQPSNPLSDIMPAVQVTRREGVDLGGYRSLLTRDAGANMPKDAVVHTFAPIDGTNWTSDTQPIMAGPDGQAVVVRRRVGLGMVTIIGIDVTSAKLQNLQRAVMPDQFWNRILGKRLRVLTTTELAAMQPPRKKMPDGSDPPEYDHSIQGVEHIDQRIAGFVANEGRAASGLLLAFVVFVAYWLVAGPIGYIALKQRKLKQHAWVAFVAVTGAFTLIAWGGANILKPRRVHGQHFTVVDSVYGQAVQRARSWQGIFLPTYGEQSISVATTQSTGGSWKNLVTPWDPPGQRNAGAFSMFPDSRGYVVDARQPDTITVPARATTKQVQIEWAGGLPANWGMIRPLADASVPVGKEIRIVDRPGGGGGERSWSISGTLIHTLPGPLENVHIAVVLGPAPKVTELHITSVPYTTVFTSLGGGGTWDPNIALDLDMVVPTQINALRDDLLNKLVPGAGALSVGAMVQETRSATEAALAMTFFDMLKPPDQMNTTPGGRGRVIMRREATHGLDLSRWLTQPCVIVYGEIGATEPAECPIPVRVDDLSGDEVRTRMKGRTVVRWVYPLEPRPMLPGALRPVRENPADAPLPAEGGAGPGGTGNSNP